MLDKDSTRKPRPRRGSLAHLTDRDAVLQAAAWLFDKQGYVETTVQAIADRLRISKPTIYKYARGKSDILQLIINQWIDRSDAGLEEARRLEDPADRIPYLVRQWTHNAVTNSTHLKVFLSDEPDMPPKAVKRYREWSKKVYAQVRTMIIEGQTAGCYRRDADPTVTAFGILGFILLLPRWLKIDGRMEPLAVANEFLRTLDVGLKPGKPDRRRNVA